MSRRWRGLALCLAIVLLFGLGLLAASRSGPVRRLVQARTEAVLTRALGREVRLAGARLNLPAAALTLQSFRVAERSAGLTRFTAEAVRIRWRWLPLLRRQLDIQDVTLVRPRIAVAPTAATPPPRELLALPLRLPAVRLGQWTLAIRHARIQDGDVEWALPGGPAGRLASVQGSVVWSAGLPVAALEAAGLSVRIGEATRQFDRLRLEAAWSPSTVAVRRLEFAGSRGRVQAQGRVLSVTEAPQYDLEVGVQAPLAALLSVAGWPQAAEGAIELTGRLAGPLEAPTFQGDARVAVPDSPPIAPVRLAGHWQAGRLEVAAMGGPEAAPQSVQLRASFTPATALYQLRLQADGTELASLGAWPATGLALAGVAVPGPLTGLVTADVDLSGRLHDLATLRGQARLRVDGLGLAGQPAAGRLEARFATTTQALTVERAELLLPRGRFAAKGSLEFATGHLHFPIQADVQDVAPVARAFGLRLLGGRLTFGGVLAGSRDAPRLGGRLAWREARFGSRALDRIEGKVEVAGRRLNSSGLLVQVGRTRGTVRGSVEAAGQASIRFLDFGRDLRLDVRGELRPARTADLVDFLPDGLEIQGEGQASGRLAGSPRGLRGEITIRMENPRVWKERFRRGEALVSLDPTGVRVSQLVLQRGAEQIRGEVTVRQDTLSGRLDTTVMDL
ncbi:MAG TPA: hypothetical protein VMG58_17270, partial [Candidatus Sulfotelmatobacter sp.]|nr:hypothetical protein [Candidatus Sulfotelmatobacter sp.]